MAGLTGKALKDWYKDLLQVDNSNSGVDATARVIKDGEGTESALYLSDDQVAVYPRDDDTTATFRVRDKDGNIIFNVDSTNDIVRAGAGQHIVNTQVKEFNMSSGDANPDTTNTWTALQATGGTVHISDLELGTGSTPATTATIATTAQSMVQKIWYVPFNITIDSCNVWFGADAASGDNVKFSIMSYTIDAANGSTGGDLSRGTEVCVSPSTITGAGYEQAYYQALSVSSADVASGKVIIAFVHQNGTNADLSCNMQLIYHLR